MPLPLIGRLGKFSPKTEYLLALEIDHHTVRAAVWSASKNLPVFKGMGPVEGWDDKSIDSLLAACDKSISQCLHELDTKGDIKVEKVLYGLPPDWIESEKILPERKQMLKKLASQLELQAIGFVLIPDAVVSYLKKVQNSHPTEILAGFTLHYATVTLVKLGTIIQCETTRRSEQAVNDIIECLSRERLAEVLPSKIVLYSSSVELETIRQQLLNHNWLTGPARLPFLHQPKVEIASNDLIAKAITMAGGGEILATRQPDKDWIQQAETEAETEKEQANDKGKSAARLKQLAKLGFAPHSKEEKKQKTVGIDESNQAEPVNESDNFLPPQESQQAKLRWYFVEKLGKLRLTAKKIRILAAILGGLSLAAGLMLAYWFIPTATISITPQTKTLNIEFDLTADTQAQEINVSELKIPARILQAMVEKSETMTTTTTKLVGDKAKGEVTIINGTGVPKKFPAGTVITSADGLTFTLDEEVTVASASGSADPSTYQPGKATVRVTAAKIGAENNLTAGTQFKVGAFSSLDFIAKNESAFTGGSSRQAKVVTKEDYSKLRSKVGEIAAEEAKRSLSNQTAAGEIAIDQSIRTMVATEQFSSKIDDIADEVSLKQTVKATGLAIAEKDLDKLAEIQIREKIPEGFEKTTTTNRSFKLKSLEKNEAVINVSYSVVLSAKINSEQIKNDLRGKSREVAKEYLRGLPEVAKATISYKPKLPDIFATMPRKKENINIVVTAE